jgi:hypothetical protein
VRTSLPTGQRLDIVMWSDDRAVGMRGWYSYGPVGDQPCELLAPASVVVSTIRRWRQKCLQMSANSSVISDWRLRRS